MINCPGQLLELIESPCQITVTGPPQDSLVITPLVFGAGTWLGQLAGRLVGLVLRGGVVLLVVMVWELVALLQSLFVRRPVSPTDNKLPGAIARTDCVPLPGHRYRPTAGVAGHHAVGIWGHLAGATCRQVARASNARRVGVIDRDGLDASRAVATLIG